MIQHSPQRAFAIQAPLHDVGGEPEQRLIVAGMRKRSPMDVLGQIEVRIFYPFRRAEIEKMCAEHLSEPWDVRDPLGNGRRQRVVVGHRSLDDRDTANREADMPVGVLGLEESGVQR